MCVSVCVSVCVCECVCAVGVELSGPPFPVARPLCPWCAGKYFSQYLQDQVEKKALGGAAEVRNILEEVRAPAAGASTWCPKPPRAVLGMRPRRVLRG